MPVSSRSHILNVSVPDKTLNGGLFCRAIYYLKKSWSIKFWVKSQQIGQTNQGQKRIQKNTQQLVLKIGQQIFGYKKW